MRDVFEISHAWVFRDTLSQFVTYMVTLGLSTQMQSIIEQFHHCIQMFWHFMNLKGTWQLYSHQCRIAHQWWKNFFFWQAQYNDYIFSGNLQRLSLKLLQICKHIASVKISYKNSLYVHLCFPLLAATFLHQRQTSNSFNRFLNLTICIWI